MVQDRAYGGVILLLQRGGQARAGVVFGTTFIAFVAVGRLALQPGIDARPQQILLRAQVVRGQRHHLGEGVGGGARVTVVG